jgi:hypothetical protein
MRHASLPLLIAALMVIAGLASPAEGVGAPLSPDEGFIALNGAAEPGDGDWVLVTSEALAGGGTRLVFELAGFRARPISLAGRDYLDLRVAGEPQSWEKGAPALPYFCRSVIIPDDARMEVRVTASSAREFADVDVLPSKGPISRNIDPATIPHQFGARYSEDRWYPEALVAPREPYVLRDYRGLVVELHPLQYHPVQRRLRVYDRVEVEVVPVGAAEENPFERAPTGKKLAPVFSEIYAGHFLNFAPPNASDLLPAGKMLVIAYDEFVPYMEPLVAWKNRRGLPTMLVPLSHTGGGETDPEQLHAYIRELYRIHGLAYVLLVGDAAQVPAPYFPYGASDPTYSLVAGDDDYPDLIVGRLSAETIDQVILQVRKFVEYEESPMPGASWYHKGTGIGSGDGDGIGDDGEIDAIHIDYIRDDLLGFTYTQVDTIYALYGYTAFASQVTDAVNAGRSIINYCGHGSMTRWTTTAFSNAHVDLLTNHNRLPWIISSACKTGLFTPGTCFAEAWMRASDSGEPTGAVGMYASTVDMVWAPPMAAQDESIDLLVAGEETVFGALCYRGSLLMMDEYGDVGRDEFMHWHVFGDPSLVVRSDTPAPLAVEHPGRLDPEATSLDVVIPDVAGALCAVSFDDELLGAALTDETGVACITALPPLPRGEAVTLTVTGFNRMPYVAGIDIEEKLPPVIDLTPGEFAWSLASGETRTATLQLAAAPGGAETLAFRIAVRAAGTDDDSSWLRITPAFGTLAPGEPAEVAIEIATAGLPAGLYEAQICVAAGGRESHAAAALEVFGEQAAVDDQPVRGESARTLMLGRPVPNPAVGTSAISFALPASAAVDLAVFDLAGRRVRTLAGGEHAAGDHRLTWDGRGRDGRPVPAGAYVLRLQAGGETRMTRLLYLR